MKRVLGHMFNIAACFGGTATTVYGMALGAVGNPLSLSGPSASEEFAYAAVMVAGIGLFTAGYARVFSPDNASRILHTVANSLGPNSGPETKPRP